MALPNAATKLNPVQLHLLELFTKDMSDKELQEIKTLLVQYYQHKVEEEVEDFWNSKNFTNESWNKATRDTHLRRKNSKH